MTDEITSATWYSTTTDSTVGTTWGGWAPDVADHAITSAKLMINGVDIDDIYEKKEDNMRSLFRITVVDPKTGLIDSPVHVVAKDRENALLKADIEADVRANPDDYDILVEVVGPVRAKKDVQKVKVVKEDEE